MARLSRACAALVLVVISAGLTVTHAAPFAADAIDVVSLSAMLESTGNGKPASLAATLTGHYDPCKSPIVLVPGLGGSVLDVMVTDEYEPPHSACRILFPKGNFTTGYNRLWPSLAAFDFLPYHVYRQCWLDAMATNYNATTKTFSNTKGVVVQPRDYGGIDGVSNLFALHGVWGPSMSAVYEDLVARLDGTGYVTHKNLRGVPYDFRLVADDDYIASEYARLKATIEEMVDTSAAECSDGVSRPAIVFMHSLGGLYFFRFLETVDAAWKDAYIRTAVSINTPWLGAPKSLRALISGDSQGLPGANADFIASERFMGGLLWAVPFHDETLPTEWIVPILQIGARKFTTSADDLRELFSLLGSPAAASIISNHLRHVVKPKAPGVEYYCAIGHGVITEAYYAYGSGVLSSSSDPTSYREVLRPAADWVASSIGASASVRMGNISDPFPIVGILNPVPQLVIPIKGDLASDPMQGDGTVPLMSLEHCTTFAEGNNGRTVEVHRFAGGDHLGLLSVKEFIEFAMNLVDKHQ